MHHVVSTKAMKNVLGSLGPNENYLLTIDLFISIPRNLFQNVDVPFGRLAECH